MSPNGFGALWRIPTHRHVRTMRSVPTNTGPGHALWPRLQETERQRLELKRLRARRWVHEQRRFVELKWRTER
jgi:hypothetical protein